MVRILMSSEEGELLMKSPLKIEESQDPTMKFATLEGETLLALLFSFALVSFLI